MEGDPIVLTPGAHELARVRTSPKKAKYEFAALAVFGLCIAGLMVLDPLVSRLQAAWVRPDHRRAYLLQGATELVRGEAAPKGLARLGRSTAVIALTDCGECSINFPTPRDIPKGIDDIVLLAPKPSDETVQDIAKAYHATVRPLSASLIKSLNTSFVPRLYVFDKAGRLSYLQTKANLWPKVLQEYYDGAK